MKKFYERGMLDKKWVHDYCWSNWKKCIRYKLEAKNKPHPDCMLPDGSIDEMLKNR